MNFQCSRTRQRAQLLTYDIPCHSSTIPSLPLTSEIPHPDSKLEQEICHWVNQLEDGGWSHVYMTDKIYDPDSDIPAHHNPWDVVPTYWADLAKAVSFAWNLFAFPHVASPKLNINKYPKTTTEHA